MCSFPPTTTAGRSPAWSSRRCRPRATLTADFEVIVVNDGSADATAADRSTSWRAPIRRCGSCTTRRTAATAARCAAASPRRREDLIFYTDGDAQYDPGRDGRCCGSAFDDDVDLVNGYKISRSDPLHRIVIGRIYHHTVKLLFGLRVRDVDCDFRLMRRSIFEQVRLEKNSGVICLEMMKKIQDAGFRIAEVPVHHYHRAYGKSQFFNFRAAVHDRRRRAEAVVRAGRARASIAGARRDVGSAAAVAPPRRSRVTERRLPRVLPRPPRDDHRRPRLHRQQPRARSWSSLGARRPARRLADPRLRRQPLQHRRHRATRPRQHRRRAQADAR